MPPRGQYKPNIWLSITKEEKMLVEEILRREYHIKRSSYALDPEAGNDLDTLVLIRTIYSKLFPTDDINSDITFVQSADRGE